ncbi:hypothetical protein GLOIN_2v1877063 [Rhizophagus irregularis DAOM 181602=DAOM 197198]|nr:hypothetical protein GLOIN_2v1877063 [Rhizophagus irregularis DAOM 181602=DAOM 197198]
MGDERFIALNVSAKYKGNREYFSFLVKVLENPDTASSFMSYLLSRDLTSFNPRSIPDTQMKRELIEATLTRIGATFSNPRCTRRTGSTSRGSRVNDLLSDLDSTTVDPVLKQQPEPPAESSTKSESLANSKSSTEPIVESASELPIPEPDTEPEDQAFDDLYNTGKELWAKYQDASDEYDWEILAFEVEECPTTCIENKYQYYLREVVDHFKDWIEYNGNLPKTSSRKELTDLIRAYKENRNAEIIPTLSGYETMRADKGKA